MRQILRASPGFNKNHGKYRQKTNPNFDNDHHRFSFRWSFAQLAGAFWIRTGQSHEWFRAAATSHEEEQEEKNTNRVSLLTLKKEQARSFFSKSEIHVVGYGRELIRGIEQYFGLYVIPGIDQPRFSLYNFCKCLYLYTFFIIVHTTSAHRHDSSLSDF